jgi:hypothetical protein
MAPHENPSLHMEERLAGRLREALVGLRARLEG